MSEIQSPDLALTSAGAVSGTLYYQDKFFDDFSAHESGHFLCLDWLGGVASGEHMTITRNGVLFASEDLPEEIVLWIESNTDVYNLKVDKSDGEIVCNITLNLKNLILEPKKEPDTSLLFEERFFSDASWQSDLAFNVDEDGIELTFDSVTQEFAWDVASCPQIIARVGDYNVGALELTVAAANRIYVDRNWVTDASSIPGEYIWVKDSENKASNVLDALKAGVSCTFRAYKADDGLVMQIICKDTSGDLFGTYSARVFMPSWGTGECTISLTGEFLTMRNAYKGKLTERPEKPTKPKKALTISRPGWGQLVQIIGSNPGAYYMNDLEYDGFRTEYNGNNCTVKDCKLIFNFGNTVPNHPEMSEGFYFPFYIAEAEGDGLADAGKLTIKVNGEPQDYLDDLSTQGIKFIRFPDTTNTLDTSAWAGMFKGQAYEPDLSVTVNITVGDEYETTVTFDDSVTFAVVVA